MCVCMQCREQLNECAKHGTSSEAKQVGAINSLASQLKSVEEVSKLWEAHYVTNPQEYAAVAYIRPDVQYQALFPVHMIPELQVWAAVIHFILVVFQ